MPMSMPTHKANTAYMTRDKPRLSYQLPNAQSTGFFVNDQTNPDDYLMRTIRMRS
ncbi:hypothetical protein ASPCADRAFT_209471 [Aspergillus carbonarius ITEM 5010]|uniref:Uncharacterized protein n=1 Tax=Aspergillus carbonarius (strain ITEM 5010) TaxID=602072 RepID=A0A1R3RGA8_ASPC5|nr:hypothetical protein ASPCADRAFT_209471 [Aspergillus carbonarius ITEM 5010]